MRHIFLVALLCACGSSDSSSDASLSTADGAVVVDGSAAVDAGASDGPSVDAPPGDAPPLGPEFACRSSLDCGGYPCCGVPTSAGVQSSECSVSLCAGDRETVCDGPEDCPPERGFCVPAFDDTGLKICRREAP